MKFQDIRSLSVDELNKRLRELRGQSFESRMKHQLGQLGSPIEVRKLRRSIAQVQTALSQKLAE